MFKNDEEVLRLLLKGYKEICWKLYSQLYLYESNVVNPPKKQKL